MAKPRVLVLRAPGTNCARETAFAFELAGAEAEIAHINRLTESPQKAAQFQIMCLPGGFSYCDDVAAGRIFAAQIQHHLRDAMWQFKEKQKLVLGICNGFQAILKSGLLFDDDPTGPPATRTTMTTCILPCPVIPRCQWRPPRWHWPSISTGPGQS